MSKELKQLRGQMRQIVKELFPEIMNTELVAAVRNELADRLGKHMEVIANNAKQTLADIDERNKDFQSYVVRQLSSNVPALDTEAQEIPAISETTKE